LPLSEDKRGARIQKTVQIDRSAWFSLTAEGPAGSHPMDALFPQAATSAIRVYVGDRKIRSYESSDYFIRWIDKLQRMAEVWPGWRSSRERDHVLGQFREASAIYRRLGDEARAQGD
jgi:hypothetical protein